MNRNLIRRPTYRDATVRDTRIAVVEATEALVATAGQPISKLCAIHQI